MFGFTLKIAAPAGYAPDTALVRAAGTAVQLVDDAASAARGADLVVTDTWTSMGQEAEQQKRIAAFAAYQVNAKLRSEEHTSELQSLMRISYAVFCLKKKQKKHKRKYKEQIHTTVRQ